MEQYESYEVQGPQLAALGEVEQKLPAPLKKPMTARLIAVVLVLAALLGLGSIKLRSARGQVEQLYTGMSENDMGRAVEGIATTVTYRADAAANIIRISGRVLGEGDTLVQQAQSALQALNKAEGPAAQYQADADLEQALTALYRSLSGNAGDQEAGLQGQWTEYTAEGSILQHDTYNQKAEAFNQSISGFPGSIIALFSGGKAELFQ